MNHLPTSENNKLEKILFFAPILAYPPKGGPEISVINAIKVLHQVCELHIVTTVPECSLSSPEALSFLSKNCHVWTYAPKTIHDGPASILERLSRFIRREILPSWYSSREANFIKRYVISHEIKIIWIDRVIEHAYNIFVKVRQNLPSAIIVGDTEAVYSRFILRELPLVRNPFRWIRIFFKGKKKEYEERQLVDKADVITVVSEVDKEYFQSISLNLNKILRFSNTVDLAEFDDKFLPSIDLHQPCALLVGSFGHEHSPMDRAAKWLADAIMPLVWKSIPNLHLYIVGSNADKTQSHLNSKNITVIGSPISMIPYLKEASLTLVPLLYESGTRFKIIESGAAAIPCVSTTLGAEGLDITHGKNILIADSTADFAVAIVNLIQDKELAVSLGKNLRNLVETQYSLNKQQNECEKILKFIKKLPKKNDI